MIGLKRHTVRVVGHHPGWADLFASECEILHRALSGLIVDIQHVGSTAVPDLPAKPILDIAIAVRTPDLVPAIVERLTGIGYIYRGDAADDGGHLFVKEPEPDIRTAHVHVVEQGGTQWKNYILFRDTLLGDVSVRISYADLKNNLMKRFPDDRRSYTAAKNDFVKQVLKSKAVGDSQSPVKS